MESAHCHPVFAPVYAGLVAVGERTTLGRWRAELLAEATGHLLVVGAGPGRDLDHLPPAVTQVTAVEPSPAMRRLAAERVRRLTFGGTPTAMVSAVAERLPLPDASVDTVLAALVLCTVDDPDAAARELRRVLRPGGRLLVLEHVRAPARPRFGRVQDLLDPLWVRVAGGCHTNRRTRLSLAAAGFDTRGVADVDLALGLPLLAPHLKGVARAA
jgi:ubiquinone/menaquinone biosynthesis C-methylase UbiE